MDRVSLVCLSLRNAPKRTRTSNHLVRSQVLYPIELSVRNQSRLAIIVVDLKEIVAQNEPVVTKLIRCEGVVLQSLPFKERDLIVTLFSSEGLVKLFVRGKRSALMTPLTRGEFHFSLGRSDLNQFKEGSILAQHLSLRERIESLESACHMAEALLRTQLPGKSAPDLYALFVHLLGSISKASEPKDVVLLFRLKLLMHEGSLQLSEGCAICEKEATKRYGGERFCELHAPRGAIEVDERQLRALAHVRSLSAVVLGTWTLHDAVDTLFKQATD